MPSRQRQILALALPIIGGMMSQNVLNMVDTAMVGALGEKPLAAMGIASFAVFVSNAVVLGLGAGVQALVARRVGEGNLEIAARPLNGGLLLAVVLGLPTLLLLTLTAPWLFSFLLDDPEVRQLSQDYYAVRLFAIVAIGMNFAFRGYWAAIGKTGMYMGTLVFMHLINILLNYLLIYGHFGFPALGVYGAGLGTAISLYIGSVVYWLLAWRHARGNGFMEGLPSRETIASMLRLSVPSSIQQFFFAAGLLALFWIIGQIGTAELAMAQVLVTFSLFCILPGMGFGIAGATLVGRSLGAKLPDEAYRWGWDVVRLTVVALVLLGLPMLLFPDWMLGWFVNEPELIALARLPLQLLGGGIAFEAVGIVLMSALMGAGDARRVAMISIGSQWLLLLPLAWLLGPYLGFGLVGAWSAQLLGRGLQTLIFVHRWRQRRWVDIKL